MIKLYNTIYQYYRTHFERLPLDKQLHFASRLYLWDDDEFGQEQLATLRSQVTANDDPVAALQEVYDAAMQTIHHGSKNAAELRAPYFEKYPRLRLIAMLLFRATFLKTIYDIDARPALFALVSRQEIEQLLQDLLADHEAISILSTHAINVLYLYSRVITDDEALFDPQQFVTIASTAYDLDNPIHLQLYIYLYTHCIIGESQFYARAVPNTYKPVYVQMLDELETVIDERFTQINLDNKFEFLVCCKLAGKVSRLQERIEAEAQQSVSDDGDFLVDKHNANPQTTNSTLDLSEHRNVLYIMSHRDTQF